MQKIIIMLLIVLISLFFIIYPTFIIIGFFGINETDDYVENNYEFASMYKNVLNKNIKSGNGYVSLSRILYFYLEDQSLTFDEIYNDNLDNEMKSQKNIYDVCMLEKYKYFNVCKSENIDQSNQLKEIINKPFNSPLVIDKLNITSFFMEERIIYGEFDIHEALDFSASSKTEVYSVCNGEVENVNFNYKENVIDKNGGTGNEIVIRCDYGDTTYTVLYAHLYPNSATVNVGDKVTHFQPIASVGTTGYSTGNHLHFKVTKDGKAVDGLSLINFNYVK